MIWLMIRLIDGIGWLVGVGRFIVWLMRLCCEFCGMISFVSCVFSMFVLLWLLFGVYDR